MATYLSDRAHQILFLSHLVTNKYLMENCHVLCVIAWNRPYYLQLVLESLQRAKNIDKYTVLFFFEPGCASNVALAQNFTGCKEKRIVINDVRLGCHANKKKAMQAGFALSDFVILVEDDIVLAEDALQYFEQMCDEYATDDDVFTVTAYSPRCNRESGETCMPIENFYRTMRRQWYHPWAWGTWRNRWNELQQQKWTGRDTDICNRIRGNRCEISPVLSRANNIGLAGWHTSGEEAIHAKQQVLFWAGTVLHQLRHSSERFREHTITMSRADAMTALTQLYQEVFERDPDECGTNYYLPKLVDGSLQDYEVRFSFIQSEEYKNKINA